MSPLDEQALSRQLREEVDALDVPPALGLAWSHDLEVIRSRGRRRRLLRVHAARVASVLTAAAVAGVLVATWPTSGAEPAPPAGRATVPSASTPEPSTSESSTAGPALTGTAAVTVEGLADRADEDPCAVPGTLTRTAASSTVVVCGGGPAAVVAPLQRADWFAGYPAVLGLQLVDEVPAWVSWEFSTETGDRSGLRVVVPSLGVRVLLFGTPEEVDELLADLRLGGAPSDTAARNARASEEDPVLVTLTSASGLEFGLVRDAETIRAVTGLLDGAVRRDAPGCVPALADTAQLDLQTDEDSDPATGPVAEYTYLVVDTSGACDLVYSSTGAVLQVDTARLTPLLAQVLSSGG